MTAGFWSRLNSPAETTRRRECEGYMVIHCALQLMVHPDRQLSSFDGTGRKSWEESLSFQRFLYDKMGAGI